jgi:glucose-1-phosphate adenylyltransferase
MDRIASPPFLSHPLFGLRSVIGAGSTVAELIIMGNDSFETKNNSTYVLLAIGRNCQIEKAIIDKNVHIGNNVVISPLAMAEMSKDLYTVKD